MRKVNAFPKADRRRLKNSEILVVVLPGDNLTDKMSDDEDSVVDLDPDDSFGG